MAHYLTFHHDTTYQDPAMGGANVVPILRVCVHVTVLLIRH
jgi:hypothetical protein